MSCKKLHPSPGRLACILLGPLSPLRGKTRVTVDEGYLYVTSHLTSGYAASAKQKVIVEQLCLLRILNSKLWVFEMLGVIGLETL